ncbi:hypothetical protein HYX58_00635 [Candidatus Dependentiae bacterium]|nr:hypothetical protein [Candidatus Dependentiae bacterium]
MAKHHIHSAIIFLLIATTGKAVISEVEITPIIAKQLTVLGETNKETKDQPAIVKNDAWYFIAALVSSSFHKKYFLFDVGENVLNDGSINKLKMADVNNLIETKLLNTSNTRIEWCVLKEPDLLAVKKTFGKNTRYELCSMSGLFSKK